MSHPNTTSSPTYSIIDLGAGFAPARLNRKGMVVGSLNGQAAYYKFGKASLFRASPEPPGQLLMM